MTTDEQVTTAKHWATRLEIHDWPTIWRVDDIAEPDITIGDRDIVTIPADAQTEPEVLAVVLKYAYHNVPADQTPSSGELEAAANGLVTGLAQ